MTAGLARMRDLLFGLPRRSVTAAIESPRLTMWCWITLSLWFASTLLQLDLDTSTSTFLDQSSPAWAIYQHSLDEFGGDEFIVVALEASAPFDRDTLGKIEVLTSAMESLPGVRRVDSLSTVPLIRAGPDGELLLDAALEDGVPQDDLELARLVGDLERDPIARDSLFSRDGRIFAINVMLDDAIGGDRTGIVAAIESLMHDRNARASGVPLFRTEVNSRTYVEVLIFVPITLLCVGLVVALAFASLRPVSIPLAVGAVGSLAAVGAMSLSGVSLSLSTMVLPSILLALGCAYSMHVLTAGQGIDQPGPLGLAVGSVSKPVALSGLTTAIGFLAMASVRIDAIQQLALFGALGVVVLTAAALSLAPALMTLVPIPERRSIFGDWIRARLRPVVLHVTNRYRTPVLGVWLVALSLFLIGVFALRVSTDIIIWFPKGTEIRDDYEVLRDQLSGISPVNVVVHALGSAKVTEPRVIAAIDELGGFLEAQPEVGKALSVADPLRRIHAVYSDDGDGSDAAVVTGVGTTSDLPDSRALNEQYLVLLESVDYIDDVITGDRTGANLLLRVDDNGSDRLVALGERIDEWWVANGPDDFRIETTGLMYEFGRSEEQIAWGQAAGLSIALLSIGAVLLLILRVPKSALVALVPNAVPLVITFGAMGLAGIPLDAATVCLGSLALGIAVDDTIHVMTGYTDRRKDGVKPLMALDRCMEDVLPALVFTTISIVAGFAVLALSQFTLIRNLGLVTSGLVFLCLLADMFLLPPLLLLADRKAS